MVDKVIPRPHLLDRGLHCSTRGISYVAGRLFLVYMNLYLIFGKRRYVLLRLS